MPLHIHFVRELGQGHCGIVFLGRLYSHGPQIVGKLMAIENLGNEPRIYRLGLHRLAGDVVPGIYGFGYPKHPEYGLHPTAMLVSEYPGTAMTSFDDLTEATR